MSIYSSGWSPRGARKTWERCSVGKDSAQLIISRYIDEGNAVDACGWFDDRDALRILVADTDTGSRITFRSNKSGFNITIERGHP